MPHTTFTDFRKFEAFTAVEESVRLANRASSKAYFIGLTVLLCLCSIVLVSSHTLAVEVLRTAIAAVFSVLGPLVSTLADAAVFAYMSLGVASLTLWYFAESKSNVIKCLARRYLEIGLDKADLPPIEAWSRRLSRNLSAGTWSILLATVVLFAVTLTQFERNLVLQPLLGLSVVFLAVYVHRVHRASNHRICLSYALITEEYCRKQLLNSQLSATAWIQSKGAVDFLGNLVDVGLLPKDLKCAVLPRSLHSLDGYFASSPWPKIRKDLAQAIAYNESQKTTK